MARAYLEQSLELKPGHAGHAHSHSEFRTATAAQATILRLQRSAGNRAVADLLALQRCGGTPCDCPHDEREAMPGANASVQREEADAGTEAPPRYGTTCIGFTSFAEFFRGTAPPSRFAAKTVFHILLREGRVAVDPDRTASWVNRRRVPVDGRRTAQTAGAVAKCRRHSPGGATTGDYTWAPSGDCPASAALREEATATTRDECETVIGAQLDDEDRADMARLLRHEEYHLSLACALAVAGNSQIAQGADPKIVLRQVKAASAREQVAYDNETDHGCKPDPQATWEGNIDSGAVAFP